MAVPVYLRKAPRSEQGKDSGQPTIAEWMNVADGDECEPAWLASQPCKSVDVEFVVKNANSSVSIQGGNDPAARTPKPLNDVFGKPVAMTENGIVWVLENTAYLKPVVMGPGTIANIRVCCY